MATSAVNVPSKSVARRLSGMKFMLSIVFNLDGEPWDISSQPIKVRVRQSNNVDVIEWDSVDYEVTNQDDEAEDNSVLYLEYVTPQAAGLGAPSPNTQTFKCLVYLDEIAGKQPLMQFTLNVDPEIIDSLQNDYGSGPLQAEPFVLNITSTTVGVDNTVAAGYLIRILQVESRIEVLEATLAPVIEVANYSALAAISIPPAAIKTILVSDSEEVEIEVDEETVLVTKPAGTYYLYPDFKIKDYTGTVHRP